MKQNKKREYKIVLELSVLGLMIICMAFHFVGSHMIDNSLNVLKISYDEEIDIFYSNCDRAGFGICYDYTQLYMLGQQLISISHYVLAVDVLIIFFMYLYKEELKN